jgi:pantoate--beta-alanine ligase
MTQVAKSVIEWRTITASDAYRRSSVGFVPTMGALHEGHRSLISKCRAENDVTVVSIFVNPTQFNNPADLRTYPRTFAGDLKILEASGVDYLFAPEVEELYPDSYRYRLHETTFSEELCGQFRPGHFEGVLTVVMKLLQLVNPQRAYFGEKDYQQFVLIKAMAESFFLQTEIVPCPTVRDEHGVALSSRNALLSPDGKRKAAEFARLLRTAMAAKERIHKISELGTVDYIEERMGRRFGAIHIDGVRLIDNVEIRDSEVS